MVRWIKRILQWIISLFKRKQGRLIFNRVSKDGTLIEKDITMLILTNTQEVDLAIQPLDAKGKPAQVDGVPTWLSSNPALVSLVVSEDGLSCVAKAMDNGSAQISVSADADLGAGIKTLTAILDIEVVSGGAVSLGVIAGTPREQG